MKKLYQKNEDSDPNRLLVEPKKRYIVWDKARKGAEMGVKVCEKMLTYEDVGLSGTGGSAT